MKIGKIGTGYFENLKSILISSTVLAYPDFTQPFELHIDAAKEGLGAVMYQEKEGKKKKIVAFASRNLSRPERNYPAFKFKMGRDREVL